MILSFRPSLQLRKYLTYEEAGVEPHQDGFVLSKVVERTINLKSEDIAGTFGGSGHSYMTSISPGLDVLVSSSL